MTKVITNETKIQEVIGSNRYIDNIYPSKEFLEVELKRGKQLSLYIGMDPTAPDLHLGHSTNLLALKKFQEMDHRVIILIGDFTARIGDPTGKDETRKPLTENEIQRNLRTYKEQIGKILDLKKTEFKQNSRWLEKLVLKDFIRFASLVTVQQLLHRDMFQERLKSERSIALHEFIYPLLQGYDSVAMKVDGEMGGTDQTFNMLIGRVLMGKLLKKEKFVITTKLLENPLTKKKLMSKSEHNYISLQDNFQEMYAKILALPDEVVFNLFELCTEVPFEKINALKESNVLTAKHELAYEITKIYHGEKGALLAREEFNKIFRQKEVPSKIEEIEDKGDIISTLVAAGIISSRSEAKRLIDQGAIKINGQVIKEWDAPFAKGDIIQVGPKKFAKIKE